MSAATALLMWVSVSILDQLQVAPKPGGLPLPAPLALYAIFTALAIYVTKETADLLKHESVRSGRMFKKVAERAAEIRVLIGVSIVYYAVASVCIILLPWLIDQQWLSNVVAVGLLIGTTLVALGTLVWLIERHQEIYRFIQDLETQKRGDKNRASLLNKLTPNGSP